MHEDARRDLAERERVRRGRRGSGRHVAQKRHGGESKARAQEILAGHTGAAVVAHCPVSPGEMALAKKA